MDWTPEMTEVLQLMNRIRQVISKQSPVGYANFIRVCEEEPKLRHTIQCRVDDFDVFLHEGDWFVVVDASNLEKTVQVFDGKMASNVPNYTWDAAAVRTGLVPALDREMVLEDLSRLG